jgi:hypothetical protein
MTERQAASKVGEADTSMVARRQWLHFKRALDNGHDVFRKDADTFDGYYAGEQWAEEDLQKLAAVNRPALTMNMILPTVNTVLGLQSSSRVDITFKPRRMGFQENADALAQVALQIQDANRYDWVESEVFQDGLITGRGYFDIRLCFKKDLRGEIKIKAVDPRNVVLDIEAKEYDPNTWNRVFTYSWVTLNDIAELYGKEKAARLGNMGLSNEGLNRDLFDVEDRRNTFGDAESVMVTQVYGENEDKTVRSVRVVEQQHRQSAMVKYFVDYKTGDMSVVPEGWGDEQILAFQQKFGLGMTKRFGTKVRWTVTAGDVVLFDGWSLYDDFTIVPYFAFFRRGKPFGLVKNLISPQDMYNKASSQELHVVNTTANSGWTVEEGTLVNMDDSELEARGAETGLVVVHTRGSNPPQKIQPNQVPTGLDRIGTKAAVNIRTISGVNDGMLGDSSPEVSGVALEHKRQTGAMQAQVPLDNLAKSRHILAGRMLNLMQRFYTEERVLRIVRDAAPGHSEAETEVHVNAPREDGTIERDLTVGEYDVVISTQPNRDSFGDTQFAAALSLREAGIAIPDHIVVEYSPLARKREVSELLKQVGGFAEPSEEELEMQQIQQQMALRQAELELSVLESEIMELNARAQLQAAKAESLSATDRQRMMDLEAKVSLKREEYQLRLQLAQMTRQSRMQDVGSRMMSEHARLATQREIALRKPAPKTPTKGK